MLWFVDGEEGTEIAPINLKTNEAKHLEVVVRTDGQTPLDNDSVKWEQMTLRPATPLGPGPALKINALQGKQAGSAWQFLAIVRAPPNVGMYRVLEFDVSARVPVAPGNILHCAVTVTSK